MEDEKYMRRCIQLARNGQRNVAPNPMVGAVIVCDGQIIGEGYHIRYGQAHAEVNAICSVKDQSLLKRSTIYVSLEPCSHYGKTPPCVDLIIEKEIPRIVIGCQDPFPEVAGKSIQKLKALGKEVVVGVLEKECLDLIKEFVTLHTLHRPYITLKWAESADQFMDYNRTEGHPAILSTPLTAMLVHKKRSESTAIMVGTRTALLDNPALTVRHWSGKNPVRLVIDRHLSLPETLHLFDRSTPTLVFSNQLRQSRRNLAYYKINESTDTLEEIMAHLYRLKRQTLFVEGGSQLLQSFIDSNLWDEILIEKSPMQLSNGVKSPQVSDKTHHSTYIHFGREIWHYINKKT